MNDALTPAQATAEWWADKVFGGIPGSSGGGGLTDMLSIVAGVQGRPAEPSKRDAFVAALTERVEQGLSRGFGGDPWVCLSTDYGPDGVLADVAEQVGVSGFPWKSITSTTPDYVTAALGYGAGSALIWQAEGWERPSCNQGQYDLSNGDREPWRCSALMFHELNAHVFDIPDPLCTAVYPHGFRKGEVCRRSAGDAIHAVDSDDRWTASHAHEFVANAEASSPK